MQNAGVRLVLEDCLRLKVGDNIVVLMCRDDDMYSSWKESILDPFYKSGNYTATYDFGNKYFHSVPMIIIEHMDRKNLVEGYYTEDTFKNLCSETSGASFCVQAANGQDIFIKYSSIFDHPNTLQVWAQWRKNWRQ